jgi:GABA permease
MNAVVLTAVLSCLNSGVYTASRMLFVLAGKGEAPAALTVTSRRSVPVRAILASTFVGYLAVVASYISPDTVFLFLLNSSGAVILFVYLLIAASELVLRLKTPDDCLKIKMWGFPLLTLATIAAMVAVLAMMAFQEEARSQLILSLTSVVVVIGAYFLKKRSLSP